MEMYQDIMAIVTGSLCEITLNMLRLSQQVNMVFQYRVIASPLTPSAVVIAETWWNHVKTVTRALAANNAENAFKTVRIRELDNSVGDYAEYDIPLAEQTGTRTGTLGDAMPPYVAVGIRLVVGTRATRPGQKRIPFVQEGDNVGGVLGASLQALVVTWANLMTTNMVLGAPAAGTELDPIVTRKDANGFVIADQPVTGYLINSNLTTQNSRKYGRGI